MLQTRRMAFCALTRQAAAAIERQRKLKLFVPSRLAFCLAIAAVGFLAVGPTATLAEDAPMPAGKTFAEDVAYLSQHVDTLVLKSPSGQSQLAVVPAYQGRVMTSSAEGGDGMSFGWINYQQVADGFTGTQINVFGGEERFWLGPEGGQFSIFFAPGAEFEFAQWKTPPLIDTQPFDVVQQESTSVTFRKDATIDNYSRTKFELRIERQVELLSAEAAEGSLDVEAGDVDFVGYRTTNTLTNTGDKDWTRDSGLLSIWMLGMYKPGEQTTVVIPFHEGSADELGPIVNDEYFGKVPSERLKVTDGVLYFSGDGKYRSKIGLTPHRAKDICGSYDAQRGVLTIVKYNKPEGQTEYVNSMWELQEQPFAGDAVNSYNDGPPEPGADPLGPFYELETSSPALALKAGETGTHVQETYHFVGSAEQLDRLAQQLLGVTLEEIRTALK